MSDITPARQNIQIEGSRFRSAVSEELIQRLGASINFINDFQHSEKQFFLNGPYYLAPTIPQLGVDGLAVFEFNAEIIDAIMFNLVAGSSGTTELDIKRATAPGGSFTSIFSTTPKITSAAPNNAWVGVSGSGIGGGTGMTPAVLSTTLVNKGDAIRLDLLQAMNGAENSGLLIHYRPR